MYTAIGAGDALSLTVLDPAEPVVSLTTAPQPFGNVPIRTEGDREKLKGRKSFKSGI